MRRTSTNPLDPKTGAPPPRLAAAPICGEVSRQEPKGPQETESLLRNGGVVYGKKGWNGDVSGAWAFFAPQLMAMFQMAK
jgi:hypothetical protein